MYATRINTDIYHLVQRRGEHTLCGLRISRVKSEQKANTLQLIDQLTPNLMICKHCERIKEQESFSEKKPSTDHTPKAAQSVDGV